MYCYSVASAKKANDETTKETNTTDVEKTSSMITPSEQLQYQSHDKANRDPL
jgi:hypothetical protein